MACASVKAHVLPQPADAFFCNTAMVELPLVMQTAAVRYRVRPMQLDDIQQVMEVERESFPTAWPQTAFRHELQQNRLGRYLIAEECSYPSQEGPPPEAQSPSTGAETGPLRRFLGNLRHLLARDMQRDHPPRGGHPSLVVGFIGVWLLPDEAHIVTVAVRGSHRRCGIGEMLLIAAIQMAQESGQSLITLECRVSNTAAVSLYEKYGFQQAGLRTRYYSNNNEDAYILTVSPVTSQRYRDEFQRLGEEHRHRWGDYELIQ